MKTCPKCKESKPLDQFYKNPARKDGLRYNCKACARAYEQSREYKACKRAHRQSPEAKAAQAAWRQTPQGRYHKQREHAAKRGIPFLLTFEQWIWLWGSDYAQRGRRAHELCMARHGDIGPYAVGNVKIVTMAENLEEARANGTA